MIYVTITRQKGGALSVSEYYRKKTELDQKEGGYRFHNTEHKTEN
jgi:hypothetical protein